MNGGTERAGERGGEARTHERAMVLLHAAAGARPALAALLALDDALGRVPRTTREPIVGQMRLAWWREALARLDTASPPAEPVLAALAASVLPRGVAGAVLAGMVDGWEALLAEPLADAALETFADARGAALFAAVASVLGGSADVVAPAGRGWALADLATHVTVATVAASARAKALAALSEAFAGPWPRALRPLGALALLARADLAGVPPGSPRRAARILAHRLTGR